jgi:hypothetical protein
VEQRGTLFSQPILSCPEVIAARFTSLTRFQTKPEEETQDATAVTACRGAQLLGTTLALGAANIFSI